MKSRLCLVLFIVLLNLNKTFSLSKRCIKCRSRGDLGSCSDPIPFNISMPDAEPAIHVIACSSGWCGKMIEGTIGAFRLDDYGLATERMCLQRPPSDYEERCAYTVWNNKKVYMCFCTGDLCNSAGKVSKSVMLFVIPLLACMFNLFTSGLFW